MRARVYRSCASSVNSCHRDGRAPDFAASGRARLARTWLALTWLALTWVVLAVGAATPAAGAPSPAAAHQSDPPTVPLAYVRTLAVSPTALLTLPDAPLPSRPPAPAKRSVLRWQTRQAERAAFVRLRRAAAAAFDESLRARLGRITGVTVIAAQAAPRSLALRRSSAGRLEPDTESLVRLASATNADACLAACVDRFGTRTGIEREVWMRVAGVLLVSDGRQVRGSFYALGVARTGRRLFGHGFQKPDSLLVSGAADQAARALAHTLETGEESPFARSVSVAIVPVAAPDRVAKQADDHGIGVPLPALVRQRDVLLQPEIGPVARLVDDDVVRAVMSRLGLGSESLWPLEESPDVAVLQRLARNLGASYLFLGRIGEVRLADEIAEVSDGPLKRRGLVRRADVTAEAALFRAADGRTLWSDHLSGATTSRTEYVRHQPRLRTDEQCVVDAAREAFAYLRFSLNDYLRRFER